MEHEQVQHQLPTNIGSHSTSSTNVEVNFRILPIKERGPEGYRLATVDEASQYRQYRHDIQLAMTYAQDLMSNRSEWLRLKDGCLNPHEVFEVYQEFYPTIKYKLAIGPLNHPSEIQLSEVGAVVALFYACQAEDEEEMQDLLRRNNGSQLIAARLGIGPYQEVTALHLSAKTRKLDALKFLLSQKDVDVATRDNNGDTILGYAARSLNAETMKELIGIDSVKKLINVHSSKGGTPLMYALVRQDPEVVALLLKVDGIELDSRDTESDRTAIHYAAESTRYPIIIEKLLKAGANAKVKDRDGETPLHIACRVGALALVRVLLKACPELETMSDSAGETPIIEAAQASQAEIVKELLNHRQQNETERPFLLCERDNDGRNALHWAVVGPDRANVLNIVKQLLEHADQKGYKDLLLWSSAGPTLGTAHKIASYPEVKRLLSKEMENSQSENSPKSLVLRALKLGQDEIAKDFINRGADRSVLYKENSIPDMDLEKVRHRIFQKASDQPTYNDKLGRTDLAKGIAALLLNPIIGTPIAVGIYAKWGTGKSSMMLQVETILLLTMFQRALPFSLHKIEDLPGKEKLNFTKKGRTIFENVTKEIRKSYNGKQNKRLQDLEKSLQGHSLAKMKSKVLQCIGKDYQSQNLCTTHEGIFWSEILIEKWSTYHPMLKALAIADNGEMVESKSTKSMGVDEIRVPSVLTVSYNAWLYENKIQAAAGLALKIIEELENCMNTSQWLRTCWEYAWTNDPHTIFLTLMLPMILTVVLGGWIAWLAWKLLSLSHNSVVLDAYRYGSVPVSVFVIAWTILRNVLNVIKPVSQQLLQSTIYSTSHKEKLGHQQKVIDDICFFKEQIRKKPTLFWNFLGKLWSSFFTNRDYIVGTCISKPPPSDNLRIIVFIDDLDRCKDKDYVLQIVSAINVILSVCNINVVLGVDVNMIQRAITSQLNQSSEEKSIGQLSCVEFAEKFLQKIIQVPVYLTEPAMKDMMSFLNAQLGIPKDRNNEDTKHEHNTVFHASKFEDSISREEGTSELAIEVGSIGKSSKSLQIAKKQPEGAGCQFNSYEVDVKSAFEYPDLVVENPILIATYTESEKRALGYLLERAIDDRRQPRQWKRFLNYHRLAWNILSQGNEVRNLRGWQVQLIVWVFVCWQWKDEMNKIIKNWEELVLPQKERDSSGKDKQEGTDIGKISLCKIVKRLEIDLKSKQDDIDNKVPEDTKQVLLENFCLQQKTNQKSEPEDMKKQLQDIKKMLENMFSRPERMNQKSETGDIDKEPKENVKKMLENIEKLVETLSGEYDVKMEAILIFQRFRFHCTQDLLHDIP